MDNIRNTFLEIKTEFEKINLYNSPKTDQEYIEQRSALQQEAQRSMRNVANQVARISSCEGSHIGQATMVVKRKCDIEVANLASIIDKNKKKLNFIHQMLDTSYESWITLLNELLTNKKIDKETHFLFMEQLNRLYKNTKELIEIRTL